MANSDIYKEIVNKGLKASDFKVSNAVTVRNILSEHDIQMLGVLTVRNIVLSAASGGNSFSKRMPRLPRVSRCCGKGCNGSRRAGPKGTPRVISCHQELRRGQEGVRGCQLEAPQSPSGHPGERTGKN